MRYTLHLILLKSSCCTMSITFHGLKFNLWIYLLCILVNTSQCMHIWTCILIDKFAQIFVIRNGPIFRIWEDANGDTSAPHIWKHSEDTQLYYAHYSQADGAVKVGLMCFFLSAVVSFLAGCHMSILSDICILSRPFFFIICTNVGGNFFYTLFKLIPSLIISFMYMYNRERSLF